MAEGDQDDSQKTEDATQKRIDDAIKKGQVAFSREVVSFIIIFSLTMVIIWISPSLARDAKISLIPFLSKSHAMPIDSNSIQYYISDAVLIFAKLIALPLIIVIIAILLASIGQNGLILSADPIKPKLERVSIIKGFKRLFSLRSLVEFTKGVLKIAIIASITWLIVDMSMGGIQNSYTFSISDILLYIAQLSKELLIGVCIALFIIASADFAYQRYEYYKSLKMSRQDIRDEYKQTEGSPEVKSKLREIRSERARKRMISEVPKADAIITNPTHYSIAIKYDQTINEAPIVVAKGQDHLALAIREIAKQHEIPIVENPPLARALYQTVDIEQEVPFEHYHAVAEVIRYVYKLKGKL